MTIPKCQASEQLEVFPKSLDPVVEVDEDALHFQLEMLGVKLKDLKVKLTGDELSILVERKTGQSTLMIKHFYTVDMEKIEMVKLDSYLMDGILTITASMKHIPKQDSLYAFICSH